MRDFSISGEFRESTEVKSGNHARKFSGTQGMSEKDAYFIGGGGGGGGRVGRELWKMVESQGRGPVFLPWIV